MIHDWVDGWVRCGDAQLWTGLIDCVSSRALVRSPSLSVGSVSLSVRSNVLLGVGFHIQQRPCRIGGCNQSLAQSMMTLW